NPIPSIQKGQRKPLWPFLFVMENVVLQLSSAKKHRRRKVRSQSPLTLCWSLRHRTKPTVLHPGLLGCPPCLFCGRKSLRQSPGQQTHPLFWRCTISNGRYICPFGGQF